MKTIYLTIIFLLICFTQASSQWNMLSPGVNQVHTSISAVNDNTAWVGGHIGAVSRTTTAGATWSNSLVTPDSMGITNIFGIDENNALVSVYRFSPELTSVWKTSNGGGSWVQVFSQTGGHISAIEVFPGGAGIMVGDAVGGRLSIWKTTNSGSTWDSTGMYIASTGSIAENCLYTNGNNYWFGTSGGRLYSSSNSGANWSFQTVGTSSFSGIWFNGSTGLVSGSANYRTTNSGANWQAYTHPSAGYLFAIAGRGNNFWTVTRGSIYINTSTDNGVTWSTFSAFPQYTDISAARTGSSVWASTTTGVVMRSATGMGINTVSSGIPGNFSLAQNYPNPFNPSTSFEFRIAKSGFVTLKVYNIEGKEISILVSKDLHAGVYKAEFDASGLTSGVYFYRLEAGNFTETKRMLLLK